MSLNKKLRSVNANLSPGRMLFKPEWLVLGVNNVCNLHCRMCDVGTQTLNTNFATNLVGTEPMNMPVELFRKIVDEAAEYCPDVKLGYAFTEPLVYPHLIETLQYAQSKGLYTSVTTNALNLKKMAPELSTSGVKDIFISLDGPQEIHNMIRGHKSSFQRAIEGIDELRKLNPSVRISVFCVITEWNIGYLREFAEYFSKYPLVTLGFMHTNFTPQHVADSHNLLWGNSYPATVSNVEQVDISKMDLNVLWEEIKAIKSMTFPFTVSFSPELDTKEKVEQFYLQPEKLLGKRCNDVFSNIMIKSDGSVIPAHGRCYTFTFGNLNESSLSEIWNSPSASQFRKDIMKSGGLFPACSRCCSAF